MIRIAAFAALLAAVSAAAPACAAQAQTVAGARVAAVAERVAQAQISGPDRALAAAYSLSDQTLPAGSVAIAPAGAPFVSTTYVSVPVDIRVDGKLARTVVAGYRVVSFVHTAVATRDLAPGSVLTSDDLAVVRIASNGRPAVGADALLGRKMTSALTKGAPVYVESTVPDTIVKPGQPAILVVHDGPVALAADVVARTGGALGETVTVFNPQTQKAIAAIVTGPNRVELTLPGGN